MDKKSVIGFVVIGVILVAWMVYTSKIQKPVQPPKQQTQENVQDSTRSKIPDSTKTKIVDKQFEVTKTTPDSLVQNGISEKFGMFFSKNAAETNKDSSTVKEKVIYIDNAKYRFIFSDNGGGVKEVYMKGFKTWDGKPIQLVDWKKQRDLSLLFTSKDGKSINTRDLLFNSTYRESQAVDIDKDSSFVLKYVLFVNGDSTQKIIKTYKFQPDSYEFIATYEFVNPGMFIADGKYQVVWGSSLNLTEHRSDEEAQFSEGFAYMGDELEQMQPKDFDKEINKDLNGNTDFVSLRNKYFGVFIIPFSRKGDGAYLTANKIHLPDNGTRNLNSIAIKMEIKNSASEKSSFKILVGPIDYKILKAYDLNLEKTMRFSLDFIVRPIAQYMIIPFFNFLHLFIPNWGLVIIIFAIVLKIVLNPLTKKQMTSMKKMGGLNPKITAIKEKYKDDPQKMNSMVMKLYKEEGINPMGGCLPLLLQLPILYALFGVFRSTIELRQAEFIWWIKDLAAPDVLINLPFKIPLFGIDQISGLATLMGITMFIQQKMTVTDPKQKSMVYLMPIMLTLLFFSFPSGLNLYYFMFNVLSIGQQYWSTHIRPPKEDELKKPVKPSFFSKLMERMQEQQKSIQKKKR
ncbi:MAG: membrane protein insertase YidC [Ignavibacteria bacterium]|nr:membrane protein insertase YidC [Ignavibacteria bacterium]